MAKLFDSKNAKDVEAFCNEVSETILNQSNALFTGAGTSMQYGGKSWRDLIKTNIPCNSNWSETDYAQYLVLIDENELRKKIAADLNRFHSKCNKKKKRTFLYSLLDFDFDNIWTTNYDKVIEDVLSFKGKTKNEIFSYEGFKSISSPSQSFLYKINGSCSEPSSIMITKEDFISYRHNREGFLILLKRDLLCKNFLFIGTSFRDDILRTCIKDICYCITNANEDASNFATQHYAIIVSKEADDLDYITKDLVNNYSINCIAVKNKDKSYKLTDAIAKKVKFKSIFISGAKRFVRESKDEENAKKLCHSLAEIFTTSNSSNYGEESFKIISGMGMSIGNFISGATRSLHKDDNLNRYLKMAPFPFDSTENNIKHREQLIKYAGVFIFMYGDLPHAEGDFSESGMWKEYKYALEDTDNIIIPLPIENSISLEIYNKELIREGSFVFGNKELFNSFSTIGDFNTFFNNLLRAVNAFRRKKFDHLFKQVVDAIN